MRHLLMKTIAGSGLLMLGLTANAQYPRSETRYQENREFRNRSQAFDRLRADLDRAEARALPFSADQTRITTALRELNRFENDWNAGSYDQRDFDRMIDSVQRVVDANRLPDWNRNLLADDMSRMRDFWANGGD